jgi:hypothetical protein
MIARIALIFIFISGPVLALEDSNSNRLEQAERYMATSPPEELLKDMAVNMSMNLPPEDRDDFRNLLIEHVDVDTISNTIKASMVNYFTADEMAALAEFYESPIAKSAMSKMGAYMADAMPTIQAEMMRAIGAMEQAKAEKNRLLPDLKE